MESLFPALCDVVIPNFLAELLTHAGSCTGMRWGVMSFNQYWFQSPKLHISLFVAGMAFCALLYRNSRRFKSAAIAQLSIAGAGGSTKCPINTFIAAILMACLCGQVYTKGTRPKPLVQLAWLLMPCHIFTAVWIYIFLHDKPSHYGRNCYVATLLMDWNWAPLTAALRPDWGDHRFFWEGNVFLVHHALLLLLPFYFAARYHTLALSKEHVLHFTWVPTFVNFALFAPYGLFIGLNVNYQLAPPPLGSAAPAVLRSVMFRPAYVVVFVVLSALSNVLTRGLAEGVRKICGMAQQVKRKVK